jgi:hypothetical protein
LGRSFSIGPIELNRLTRAGYSKEPAERRAEQPGEWFA